MEALIIEGVKPYDGTYPLDMKSQPLTIREWGYLKKLSGYLPATASEGFNGGDPELMLALAVILLRRAGKIQADAVFDVYERIADQPHGILRWETIRDPDEEEEEEVDDPTESSTERPSSSGGDLSERSDHSDGLPLRTGTPALASSPSGQPTSEN